MTDQQSEDQPPIREGEAPQPQSWEHGSGFTQPPSHPAQPIRPQQLPDGHATPAPAPTPLSKTEERTRGTWMHIGSLVLGVFPILSFVIPLAIWLTSKDRSRMLDDHGRSALNWSITYLIYMSFSGALTVIYIGFLLLPLGLGAHVVQCIVAAVRANQRRKFKHPLAVPFLRVR